MALCAVVALFAAIIASSGPAAFADTPMTVGKKAIVTNTDGDPVRMRLGPGTEFEQIAFAHEGDSVSILAGPSTDEGGTRWFLVQTPGATGWMMAQYLRGTSAPAATAKLTGSALVANTNGDPLRVRSAPSTSGNVLGFLFPGAKVTIKDGPVTDSTGTAWYKITDEDISGWAMAMYLVHAPSSAPAAAEPAAKKPQAEPTASKPPATATAIPTATATATAKPTEKPKATPTATAATRSSTTSTMGQYRQWMEEARIMFPYRQSIDKMWSVMMCESGGNARASGGGGAWLGLFQYAPGTWGGRWNPYRGESIWDAKAQIFATAKAWSIGMQSHWSCYYHTPGR
jgi:uncharacterized protein YgiM (DUF1202 family)